MRKLSFVFACIFIVVLSGCTNAQDVQTLKQQNADLLERVSTLESQLETIEASDDELVKVYQYIGESSITTDTRHFDEEGNLIKNVVESVSLNHFNQESGTYTWELTEDGYTFEYNNSNGASESSVYKVTEVDGTYLEENTTSVYRENGTLYMYNYHSSLYDNSEELIDWMDYSFEVTYVPSYVVFFDSMNVVDSSTVTSENHNGNCNLVDGELPTSSNEVLLSSTANLLFGFDLNIGDTISHEETEYIIVGFYEQ